MNHERDAVFHRNLTVDYPIITHGEGIYLFDKEGKSYMDASSGAVAANLGHTNPKIAMAMAEQANKFTGSTAVGQTIMRSGVNGLKRVSLELGGKNAVIVMKDADIEKAAAGIIQSAFATTGQRCTSASRVIVEKEIKEELLMKLKEKMKLLKIGDGLEEDSQVGPLVNEKQLNSVDKYVQEALKEGGLLLAGGKQNKRLPGYFYEPTLISEVKKDHLIAREEIFGPVLAVIEVDSYEEAIEVNNDTIYGLSTAIYTQDLNLANRASREAISGIVYINSGTSSAEMGVAFGGMKMSGNGHREVSHHAFDVMTEWKSIYTTY